MRIILAFALVLFLVACNDEENPNNYVCPGVDPAVMAASFDACTGENNTPANCAIAVKKLFCKFVPTESTEKSQAKATFSR